MSPHRRKWWNGKRWVWDSNHTLREKVLRSLLFPSHPTGPFCFLTRRPHSDSKRNRSRNIRREGFRFKLQQRNLASNP